MSIKNKVATAVATAGLLAGIFGSALVPAAMAGSVGVADLPKASSTTTYVLDDGIYVDSAGLVPVMTAGAANVHKVHKFTMSTSTLDHKDVDSYIQFSILNAAGDPITSLSTLSASISGGTLKAAWAYEGDGTSDQNGESVSNCSNSGIGDDDIPSAAWGANPSATTVGTGTNHYGTWDDTYTLCLQALKPGKSTITVKANGVTLPAVTVDVIGKIASLTLSAAGTSSLTENNDGVDNFFKVVAKDSAGQVINDADNTFAPFDLNDSWNDGEDFYYSGYNLGEGAVLNQDGSDKQFVNDIDANSDGATHESYNRLDISSDVCETGDAGQSFPLAVEVYSYNPTGDDPLVTSNPVTVKCTGDSSTAHVTGLSVEATSGPLDFADGTDVDGHLDVYATVVDDAGRPIGAGDGNYDFTASMSATVESGNLDFTSSNNDATKVAGKVVIGYLMPSMDHARKYGYTIKLADSDLAGDNAGNDPVKFSKSFSYLAINADAVTYVPTVTMNKAKTTATIKVDFGFDCSNQGVTFDVELANGSVVYYDRTANVDGIATLSLSKRKTTVLVTVESCTDLAAVSTTKTITFK